MNFQIEIKRIIAAYSSSEQAIVQLRLQKLKSLDDYYTGNGFPPPCSIPGLSLLPVYFQEAIYDGIKWFDQDAPLEHLETELELDCIFHNSGKKRKELSPKEFEDYMSFSDDAINQRTQGHRQS